MTEVEKILNDHARWDMDMVPYIEFNAGVMEKLAKAIDSHYQKKILEARIKELEWCSPFDGADAIDERIEKLTKELENFE